MSSQHSATKPYHGAAPSSATSFSLAMRQIFLPIVREVSVSYRTHKINETRKATKREISALPTVLQEDLAFDDGTIFAALRE